MWERKNSIVLYRSWSFNEPMPSEYEYHKSFSVLFSSPPTWERMTVWATIGHFLSSTWKGRTNWSWLFPFPQVGYALKILQQVKLWLTSFSGQAWLRRTECSGLFQNGWFSPSLAGSRKGSFSDIYCANLVRFLEVNSQILRKTSMTGSPWSF